MASADGRERSGVTRDLFATPYRFDFFQAVRLLEHRRRELESGRAPSDHSLEPHLDGNGVGRDLHPHSEVVRFRALTSLGFPSAAISEIHPVAASSHDRGEPHPPEMVVTFLSLTGPNGALPRHYTELLLQRIREKDFSLRDFLDLFNHRLISLFYRAWEKYNWAIAYERSQLDDPAREPDPVTRGVYDLVGLGTTGLRGRLEVHDEVFLFYGGHYAHLPRSVIALESLLADYLEMPVAVLQCQGQWLNLDSDDLARMPFARCPMVATTGLVSIFSWASECGTFRASSESAWDRLRGDSSAPLCLTAMLCGRFAR